MRHLTLTRRELRKDGIFSELTDEQGKILAHTLEHAYLVVHDGQEQCEIKFAPKLYEGTFICVYGPHRLHSGPVNTYEITGVKGHTGILFHIGNYNKDSDGCVLLGSGIAQGPEGQFITGSKAEFADFLKMMGTANFMLTVRS